jgi:integrase/recombinase XerD
MPTAPVSITVLPYDEKTLRLNVPYHPATVEKIKQLPSRQWSKQERCWFIPNDRLIVERLIELFGEEQVMDCREIPEPGEARSEAPLQLAATVPSSEDRCPKGVDALMALLDQEMRVRNFSRQTIKNYRMAIQRFCAAINHHPAEASQQEIKRYLIALHEEHGYAPRTVNLHAGALAFFYRQVLDRAEPVTHLPRMKLGRSLPEIYSEEEVTRILTAVENPKHRLILMIAYGCGLRLSELCHLRPVDISLERRQITVRHGKGNKDRTVMIDEVLSPFMDEYLSRGSGKEWLFEGYEQGRRLSKRTIGLVFEHACQKAGVHRRGGIHGFRHSFATHLIDHGTGLRQVQELLGHGNSKTTEVYTHVSTATILKIRSPLAHLQLRTIPKKRTQNEG